MEDSYFFLLEQPRLRQFGLCGERLVHRTRAFDPAHYATANGLAFADDDAAYRDWLVRGRREGLAYAPGRDTVLKIILKAKDEPDLLPIWVRHHARIVGMENLIILDCGSTDPAYRALLDDYADRLLILPYPLYYDHIHASRANPGFFDLVAANCRYLTILDADEFLFARDGELFSGEAVRRLLAPADEPVFAGTWVSTIGAVTPGARGPLYLELAPQHLAAGTVAGKAIVRSSAVARIGHVGHNLHDRGVIDLIAPTSFGKMIVLHLTTLHPEIGRRRTLAHLQTNGIARGGDIDAAVREARDDEGLRPQLREYARRYLEAGAVAGPADGYPSHLLDRSSEVIPPLAAALDTLDGMALARAAADRLA